jgi:hypothetical protein
MSFYNQFIDTFYEALKKIISSVILFIRKGFLSSIPLDSAIGVRKETVVIHGGFDSLFEEFYCYWAFIASAGCEVIAFNGPGQGGTLRKNGIHFDHHW